MRLRHGPFYSFLSTGSSLSSTLENPNLEVTVYPTWFDKATISWKTPDDWGECSFHVYVSESDSGPFRKLTQSPVQGLVFEDTSSRKFSKYNKDFYVVEAILLDKGEAVLRSKPTSWENKPRRFVELRGLEIQRRFWLMLTKFMGVETLVFKRRTFGKRCSTCWDYSAKKVTNDQCPECMGTGWSQGYIQPYSTFMQFDVTLNNKDLTALGRSEINVIAAMTISFPEIDDWDLVFRVKDSRMYRVDKVTTTELLTSTVSQRLQLVELPKNFVEYSLLSRTYP